MREILVVMIKILVYIFKLRHICYLNKYKAVSTALEFKNCGIILPNFKTMSEFIHIFFKCIYPYCENDAVDYSLLNGSMICANHSDIEKCYSNIKPYKRENFRQHRITRWYICEYSKIRNKFLKYELTGKLV